MKHLTITADDYGPHPFINAGILDAVENNLITSVSVLVNNYEGYAFKERMDELVTAIGTKSIGIGCHLSLTSGKPLTKTPTLVNEKGELRTISAFRFSDKPAHLQEVEKELKAQIERLVGYLEPKGIQLDHVSCHHGTVGLYGEYSRILLKVMNDMGWKSTVRNPLIITKDPRFKEFKPSFMKWEGFVSAIKLIKDQESTMVKNLFEGVKPFPMKIKGENFRRSGIPVPAYLFDIYYHQPGRQILRKILKYFPNNGPYSYGELMVHLGKGDLKAANKIEHNGIDNGYFIFRRNELRVLHEFFTEGLFDLPDLKLIPMQKVPVFQCLDENDKDMVYT